MKKNLLLIALVFLITSCMDENGNAPGHDIVVSSAANVEELDENPTAEKSKRSPKTKVAFNNKYIEEGTASFYGNEFHGRKTANGSIYNKYKYTAAHRSLPMPSVVEVINLENKKSVIVVVTDRGPFKGGDKRIIDLSHKAAKDLGILNQGIAKVRVQYLHKNTQALLGAVNKGLV